MAPLGAAGGPFFAAMGAAGGFFFAPLVAGGAVNRNKTKQDLQEMKLLVYENRKIKYDKFINRIVITYVF